MNCLEIKNLGFHYPDGRQALNDISFTLAKKQRVGLIGPNGAGKSTLFLHLNGLLPAKKITSPHIHVFDLPLITSNLNDIRKKVGLLFQDPDDQIFCPTVWEDVAFGPAQMQLTKKEIAQRTHNALQQVGLSGFENRQPHHLSRGEKRRVCLAGLLACDAQLLVLDEPTSDLDPQGRRELISLLLKLPVTQLIASHDLEFIVKTCDRVIVIDKGQLIAQGNTTDILSDESLMLKHGLETPHILKHTHPHKTG